jgi:hypothetical protein
MCCSTLTYLDSHGLVHLGHSLRWLHVEVRQEDHALSAGLLGGNLVEGRKHVGGDKSGVFAVRTLHAVGVSIKAVRDADRGVVVGGTWGSVGARQRVVVDAGSNGVDRWARTSPVARSHASRSQRLVHLGSLRPVPIVGVVMISVGRNVGAALRSRGRKIHGGVLNSELLSIKRRAALLRRNWELWIRSNAVGGDVVDKAEFVVFDGSQGRRRQA